MPCPAMNSVECTSMGAVPARSRWLAILLALGCLAVLAGAVVQAGGPATPGDEPLPLLRIAVSPEQLTKELARFKQGDWIRLPRDDFEARVRRGAQAVAARKTVARVVRAHYLAELADQDLTLGHGEWVVDNPGDGAAPLPLTSLSLALSHCAWEDGRAAVVGDLDGKGLAVHVDEPGLASLFFDWSCRGSVTPQGLKFDIRLPPCPQTTLELKLPADAWPALPAKSGLLTGPHDAGAAGKKLWKLQVAGKAQVELTVRRVQSGPPPALFYQVQTRQLIAPDRTVAEYEFQMDIPHGSVRELSFEGDGALEPYEVSAPSSDLVWRWQAPAAVNGKPRTAPGTLVVEFRTPQQGIIAGLRVRCLAPGPAVSADWVSPALRLRQATCRAETLKLQFHPDMHLGRWDGGDFRRIGGTTEADGGLSLHLVDTRAAAGPPSARPRCRLVSGTAEFAVSQITRWHIEPGATSVNCEITYDVSHGQLHQLAVKLPNAGGQFQVESVTAAQKNLLRNWTQAGSLLLVELQRGLTPRTEAPRLTIRLRSSLKVLANPITLDLPNVEAVGAGLREGTFEIVVAPLFNAQLLGSSVPAASPTANLPAAAKDSPAFIFAYRDQVLSGKLRLFPRKPQIRAHSRQEIAMSPGEGRWRAQVDIESVLGRPAFLDVQLAAALSQPWQLSADGQPALIHHWQRLPLREALPHLLLLGSGQAPGGAALLAVLPRGQLWRIHFAKPLASATTLRFEGRFRAADAPAPNLPILALLDVADHESEVIVRRGDQQPAGHAVCESSAWTTCVAADGSAQHLLRLRLHNWHRPRFEVIVPGTTTPLAAKIDGGWLDRLEATPTPDGTQCSLPVQAGAAVQWIELLCAAPANATSCQFFQSVAAPHPRLPAELNGALTQRRYWRLPSAWLPWDPSKLRPRGQPGNVGDGQRVASLASHAWHAGEAWLPRREPLSAGWSDAQRAELAKAEAKIQAAGRQMTLGEALERLSGETRLVIDVEGLRAASLEPTTKLPAVPAGKPFWEGVGLIHVPCPSAALLTTPQRLYAWQQQSGGASPLDTLLDPGVGEATLTGMDQAGCFATAASWRRASSHAKPREISVDLRRAFAQFADAPETGWTEWEPLPGLTPDESLALLHAPTARMVGFILAGLWLVVGAWAARRLSVKTFFRAHLLAAALLAAAVLWLPGAPRALIGWPLLLAELGVFAVTFTIRAWPRRRTVSARSTILRPAGAALLLCTLVVAMPVVAQMPPRALEPYRVFLVSEGEPAKPFAVVGSDLLTKLDDLAARPAPGRDGCVVSSYYQGKVKGGVAEIEARYDLYQGTDKSTFVLPLRNVRLRPGVFLDGAPVFPVIHKEGYALPLQGKGFHRLTLAFEARPLATRAGDYQQLDFIVPKAGQCQLDLSWGEAVRGLYLAGGRGEQKVQIDKKGLATLHAQLGHEAAVRLRWQTPPTAASNLAKNIEVREVYYWDLRPGSLGLTAAVQFEIGPASLTQLRFSLPEGVEVRSVELADRASPALSAIRQWEVIPKGPSRQLVVSFAEPVSGKVALLIEMVPRLALTPGQWLLRLPTPLQGTTTEGFLAYRLNGMDAVPSPQNLSILSVGAEKFGEAWTKIALRGPPDVSKAHSFRRAAPAALLGLAVQPARPAAQLDLLWKVGLRHAELTGQVRLTSVIANDVLVELELPPRFKLVEVGGLDVHHWNRQDRLVQVWLRQPRKQVQLQVRGWVEHRPGSARFELAPLGIRHARAATTTVIEPETGIALMVDRPQKLIGTGTKNSLRFSGNDFIYEGTLTKKATPIATVSRAFTLVERRGAAMEMTAALHVQPRPGEVQISVTAWSGTDLRLNVPAPVLRKTHRQNATGHVWTLQFPPGLPQTITLTLHGRFAEDPPAGPWHLPAIAIDKIPLKDHWVGLVGVEAVGKDASTLRPFAAMPKGPIDFPAPPTALGAGAKIGRLPDQGGDLGLRLPPVAAPVQILLARQDAFWSGSGWAHQLRLLTFAIGDRDLRVQLPNKAVCRAVVIGDRVTVPAEENQVIPLPGTGPATVQIFWTYPAGLEGARSPRLNTASVAGLDAGVFEGSFWLPAAYQQPLLPADIGARAAEAMLNQAGARMRLCSLWVGAGATRGDLQREQQAFHDDLKQAGATLALLDGTGDLKQRLKLLAEENSQRAKRGGYEADARQPAWTAAADAFFSPSENGLPILWGMNGSPPPGPLPLVSMLDLEEVFMRSALELLVLTTIALLLFSCLRHGLAVFRTLWPEMLVSAAVVGFLLDGLSPVGAALLGIGVGLRIVWFVAAMRPRLSGWFARAGASPNFDGAAPSPPPPASP
jgi:hypothetical protein